MNRTIRKFKIIGHDMYLNDGSIIPLSLGGSPEAPFHGNTRHTLTFVTQTEIDASINVHKNSFNHLYPINFYTENEVLTTDDFRQVHIMDVSGGTRYFNLPDVTSEEVGEWIVLGRKGTTNTLRIVAGGSDILLNSNPGGMLECDDTDHDYSMMQLIVFDDGVWGNLSFGIWSSR